MCWARCETYSEYDGLEEFPDPAKSGALLKGINRGNHRSRRSAPPSSFMASVGIAYEVSIILKIARLPFKPSHVVAAQLVQRSSEYAHMLYHK
jgi:hypothetical protein